MVATITANLSPKTITDKKGWDYILSVNFQYVDNPQKDPLLLICNLSRPTIRWEVGKVVCSFKNREELEIAHFQIYKNFYGVTLFEKLCRFIPWTEPINYQRRGLGTFLLNFIIEEAKNRGVKRLYTSVNRQDIYNNPKLLNWLQRYGFRLETPTKEEVYTAVFRACLYL